MDKFVVASSMATIAFFSIGAPGHFYPNINVLRELERRGHHVHIFVPTDIRLMVSDAICAAGLYTYRTPHSVMHIRHGASMDVPADFAREVAAVGGAMKDVLSRIKPDLAIVEGHCLSAMLVCMSLNIPIVKTDATYAFGPGINYFKLCEQGKLPGVLTTPEGHDAFDIEAQKWLGENCSMLGTERSFHALLEYNGVRRICYVARNFHPNVEQFEGVDFVGPTIDPEIQPKNYWHDHSAGRRVLVSFGSIFGASSSWVRDCIHEVLEYMLADVRYVSQNECFQSEPKLGRLLGCDLFISHGGMGGTMEALYRGVPCIAIPHYPEQVVTAKMICENELGAWIPREEVSQRVLAEAVSTILKTPDFHDRCMDFGGSMVADGGYRKAADIVESALKVPAAF